MSEDPRDHGRGEPWAQGRRSRIAVGLLAGVGATGISGGLGLIGTSLDVDRPFIDPSGIILMAPVIIVPFLAAALLRGRETVAAITGGAVAAPILAIGAIAALYGSCPANMWAGVGLAAAAGYGLVIAGIAALVGARAGPATSDDHQHRRVIVLVVIGAVGALAWIPVVARLGACP